MKSDYLPKFFKEAGLYLFSENIVKLQVRSKGPGHGPGQGPVSSPWFRFKSELRYSKFSVKFSKERTWSDTIIKQATTPPPLNFLKCQILKRKDLE